MTFVISPQVFAGALDISRIGFGGRSLGLGRAQVAGRDIGAAFINPATLADFNNFRMTSMFVNLAEEANYSMIGAALPLKEGAFGCLGVGYIGATVSGIITTTSEVRSAATGTTDYKNGLFILSYARDMGPAVKFGAAAKLFSRSFDAVQNAAATGADMDIGFLFLPQNNLIAGLTLQNILSTGLAWKNGTNEDIPSSIKMGINFKPRNNMTLLLDVDSERGIHSGLEWNPRGYLLLRGGIESVPTGTNASAVNYSLGVGLQVRGFSFDYAYYIDSIVSTNSSHYFSISYDMPQRTIESRHIMPAAKPAMPETRPKIASKTYPKRKLNYSKSVL